MLARFSCSENSPLATRVAVFCAASLQRARLLSRDQDQSDQAVRLTRGRGRELICRPICSMNASRIVEAGVANDGLFDLHRIT